MEKPKYESAAQKGGNPYEKSIEKFIEFANSSEGFLSIRNLASKFRKHK